MSGVGVFVDEWEVFSFVVVFVSPCLSSWCVVLGSVVKETCPVYSPVSFRLFCFSKLGSSCGMLCSFRFFVCATCCVWAVVSWGSGGRRCGGGLPGGGRFGIGLGRFSGVGALGVGEGVERGAGLGRQLPCCRWGGKFLLTWTPLPENPCCLRDSS